ncbi:BID domain-containing T4SS effector [Bartonella rattaustraliani]|uniref:BID domain-containing T4SS effector n=1 Tax=Bartonella rattaustraliani TaxID=481139 RepID=UPI0002D97E37|nr:BID domain-containing T4SS effector [Bartonella rattaustraliani]
MKKHQSPTPPQPEETPYAQPQEPNRRPTTQNPEGLYAKVNKLGRGQQRPPLESVYAKIEQPGGGQHHPNPELPYTLAQEPNKGPIPQAPNASPYSIPRGKPDLQAKSGDEDIIQQPTISSSPQSPGYRPQQPVIPSSNEGGEHRPQYPIHPPNQGGYTPFPITYTPQGEVSGLHATSQRKGLGASPYLVVDLSSDGGKTPPGTGMGPYSVVELFGKDGEPLQKGEDLYEEVPQGRTTPAKEYFPELLKQNIEVQYGRAEIRQWCQAVYGNKHALENHLSQVLENPMGAGEVLNALLENPEMGGKLAGTKALGMKSPRRKEAEDDFQHLCAAFDRHVLTTQRVQKELIHKREGPGQRRREPEGQEAEHSPHHHNQHRHHRREERRHSPEQQQQRSRDSSPTGMSFAM